MGGGGGAGLFTFYFPLMLRLLVVCVARVEKESKERNKKNRIMEEKFEKSKAILHFAVGCWCVCIFLTATWLTSGSGSRGSTRAELKKDRKTKALKLLICTFRISYI